MRIESKLFGVLLLRRLRLPLLPYLAHMMKNLVTEKVHEEACHGGCQIDEHEEDKDRDLETKYETMKEDEGKGQVWKTKLKRFLSS